MIAAFLALQAATLPAPPAPRAPPTITVRPVVVWPNLLAGMSPEGRATMEAEMKVERERSQAHAARLRGALERLERETQRNPIDVRALKKALDARDAIEIERIRQNSGVAAAVMGRLSPADRLIAVQAVRGIGQAPQRAVTQPIIPPRP